MNRLLRAQQALFLWAGVALLGVFAAARIDAQQGAERGMSEFSAARDRLVGLDVSRVAKPDLSLWADGRIEAYRESLTVSAGRPVGVLRIGRLSLEVPIFEGTSDLVLNRGVGRIEGTAMPGEAGNLGIAGHRDGFFRPLKDIEAGDLIAVEHLAGSTVYRVTETLIVNPDDTWVLQDTGDTAVTLVTCYPFYFVGHAPQRFIVRGVPANLEDSGV